MLFVANGRWAPGAQARAGPRPRVAHGALFGMVLGTALSTVGSVGAFAIGFGLGRRGTAVVARHVSVDEHRRTDRFLRRWGVVAIILSRPVPILAETVSLVAGTSTLGWGPALGAAVVGSLPAAALYAVAGAASAGLAATAAVLGVIFVLGVGAAASLAVVPITSRRSQRVGRGKAGGPAPPQHRHHHDVADPHPTDQQGPPHRGPGTGR